ncbi:MAG: SET domain-containing protein-lysine N-methyltransferase [Planctomycetota bacterium]|nr:SET domain-containing protein-lysine N-methyltransferase [Planctomycetota bacterium]
MNSATLTAAHDLVRITLDPVKGRCVVAAGDIAKGTRILADPVVVVPAAEKELMDRTVLGRYVFEWDDGVICAVLGLGSLINHAPDANVELVSNFDDHTMDFLAVRDIAAGEEIVYDYGHETDELESYYGIPRDDGARG